MLVSFNDGDDDKPSIINKTQSKKKSNKNTHQILKSEILHYLERDCNVDTKLATKSNILFNFDEKNNVTIKGLSIGKICLSNIDDQELSRIVGKYDYSYKIE